LGREAFQEGKQPITAKLNVHGVVVSLVEANLLRKAGYGEVKEGHLVLTPLEALYLLDRGRIRVYDSQGKCLSLKELLEYFVSHDSNTWIKYLVYSDLRRRGYIVKPGFRERGIEFRVYRKGAEIGKEAAKYLVVGITEGALLDVAELQNLTERSRKMGKELILAVIDRQGEITYYDVSWATL